MWSGSGAAQVSALRLDEPATVNDKVTPARLCVNQPPALVWRGWPPLCRLQATISLDFALPGKAPTLCACVYNGVYY